MRLAEEKEGTIKMHPGMFLLLFFVTVQWLPTLSWV